MWIMLHKFVYFRHVMIPTKCMVGPSEGRGVRQLDDSYLKVLEARIRNAPNAIVAPLVASIKLTRNERFNEKDLESYTYEMIGGNHSSKPQEALPEALTTPWSIRQLYKELNSRKEKRTISEEFKRKCQGTEK